MYAVHRYDVAILAYESVAGLLVGTRVKPSRQKILLSMVGC
jgi:hypothetical protein